jgi:DNA-binding response OmpR family regulator
MGRVLIVEDEAHLAEGLRFNIEAEGHTVDVLGDGNEAVARLLDTKATYDVIVLDVMLPGRDGFEVVSDARKAGVYVPILMLTARGRPEDVLRGFEAGADDYLTKPFELAILLARVRGLLRRHNWMRQAAADHAQVPDIAQAPDTSHIVQIAGKTLDLRALELRGGDRSYHLTMMECELLKYLVQNAGQAVSRKAILENVWDLHEDTDTRAIDNFIVRLRRYVEEDPAKPKHLLTVRGVGYKFISDTRTPTEGHRGRS